MKYIIYEHSGSKNHGCEALIKSTVKMIKPQNKSILVSWDAAADKGYGIDRICDVYQRNDWRTGVPKLSLLRIKAFIDRKIKHDNSSTDFLFDTFNAKPSRNDVYLHIGGDTYCYGIEKELSRDHTYWRKKCSHTVLWGCSIEPEVVQIPGVANDLANYSLITARESITYEALKKVNRNVVQVTDPAFTLKSIELPLPNGAEGMDLVGINTSHMVESYEKYEGLARQNIDYLISGILDNTDMGVLLIPHVVLGDNDDRTILKELYEQYKRTKRVFLIEDHTCEELKGYISHCRFFVGARTHATIAAYSKCIPTLVLGYSVKARGIARDLFGSENRYVLPVQQLERKVDLFDCFMWIVEHEQQIKNRLSDIMPNYIEEAYIGVAALEELRSKKKKGGD